MRYFKDADPKLEHGQCVCVNVCMSVSFHFPEYPIQEAMCESNQATSWSTPADGYFAEDTKSNLCYCESCHKLRGDEAYYKKGEPPRDYALPFGWCRFTLRSEAYDTTAR